MAVQQAADDAADRSASGFASMYSVKAKKQRGRLLPAQQLPAARQLVQGKLNAKAMRSGASVENIVSGCSANTMVNRIRNRSGMKVWWWHMTMQTVTLTLSSSSQIAYGSEWTFQMTLSSSGKGLHRMFVCALPQTCFLETMI